MRGDDRTLKDVLARPRDSHRLGEAVGGALHGYRGRRGGRRRRRSAMECAPLARRRCAIPIGVFVGARRSGCTTWRRTKTEHEGRRRRATSSTPPSSCTSTCRRASREGDREARRRHARTRARRRRSATVVSTPSVRSDAAAPLRSGHERARTMIESGGQKEEYLTANPEIAKRYATDAAFHNGFDALCWAKNDSLKTGGNPGSYRRGHRKLQVPRRALRRRRTPYPSDHGPSVSRDARRRRRAACPPSFHEPASHPTGTLSVVALA